MPNSPAPRVAARACYALTGYELDPCLPADDTVLQWLGDPLDCEAEVTAGPFSGSDEQGRTCCYSVRCREPR